VKKYYAILGLLVLSVGICVADCGFGAQLIKQYLSKKFPSTLGQITHSEVTHFTTHDRYGGEDITCLPDIRYHYEVNGQNFEGKRFRYHKDGGLEFSEKVVATYPVGLRSQVFYNPRNPQDSLLSPGFSHEDFVGIMVLTPLNLAIIILCFLVIRALTKISKQLPNS